MSLLISCLRHCTPRALPTVLRAPACTANACTGRRVLMSTAAAAEADPSSSASSISRADAVEKAVAARVRGIFYQEGAAADDSSFSRAHKQVYSRIEDEPPLPLIADHGLMYGASEGELAGHSEAVRRVLSTRTGDTRASTTHKKAELRRKFELRPHDTGSSRVQVAMLTERITRLALHSSRNKHDKSCVRSLTALTVRRRKLLAYMMRSDFHNYRLIVKELQLRPLPVFNDAYLPKVRPETHAIVNERNKRLKNRRGRGHLGH